MMAVTLPADVDLDHPSADPPPGCRDELMWRTAYTLFTDHVPSPCPECASGAVCEARFVAVSGLATAMGEVRLISDYWRGLVAARRADAEAVMYGRRRFDPGWLAVVFEGEQVYAAIARRDIGCLFRFLRTRGWGSNYLARVKELSGNSVRDLCNDKRDQGHVSDSGDRSAFSHQHKIRSGIAEEGGGD